MYKYESDFTIEAEPEASNTHHLIRQLQKMSSAINKLIAIMVLFVVASQSSVIILDLRISLGVSHQKN